MKFDDFDYDEHELEASLCADWGLDAGSLRHFRKRGTNVYKGTCQGQPVFIKVTAESIRPQREIEGASAYLKHLTDRGAPVSGLVMRQDGERYGVFEAGSSSYFLTMLEAVPGTALTNKTEDPAHFFAWGEALGELHNAAEGFDGTPYAYITGDGEWMRAKERLADAPDNILERIAEIEDWRRALPRPKAHFPVTHGDMNAGNLVWDGQRIRIIDFDEPMYTWNAADMARPFRETQGQSDERRKDNFETFMKGYQRHRTPQFHDPSDYSNFVTVKNLEMYGWGLKVWKGSKSFDGGDLQAGLDGVRDMILKPLKLD